MDLEENPRSVNYSWMKLRLLLGDFDLTSKKIFRNFHVAKRRDDKEYSSVKRYRFPTEDPVFEQLLQSHNK